MKLLASAVALIMVGLTGMWLWFDATADAREDLPGVVVSVDDVPADLGVVQPDDAGSATQAQVAADAADQSASAPTAADQGDRAQADREAVTSRLAMVDTLVTTLRAGRLLSGSSGGAAQSPAPTTAPAPQPVNPAPATPPGMCWDDGELEDCDDWDDDGDDDWDDR